jgi:hypothetical protein
MKTSGKVVAIMARARSSDHLGRSLGDSRRALGAHCEAVHTVVSLTKPGARRAGAASASRAAVARGAVRKAVLSGALLLAGAQAMALPVSATVPGAGSAGAVEPATGNVEAGASSGAQLTGGFTVTLTIVTPHKYRGQRYSVAWGFTPACDQGACNVQVDTEANACPSGQCAQPPSAFDFAGDNLSYLKGRYKGTFVITTSCNASSGYWPYAYNQHTTLALTPSAVAAVGSIGNQPLKQVSAIAGTLTISGSPNATGRKQGCGPYLYTLSVHGKAQGQ